MSCETIDVSEPIDIDKLPPDLREEKFVMGAAPV